MNLAFLYQTFRSIPSILTRAPSECTTTPQVTPFASWSRLRQESHRLAYLRSPAPAHRPLKGGHQTDADVLGRGQAMQQVHRPHQVHGDDSPVILEHLGKMSDWAAQRPVAKDVALLGACLRVEGMPVLPAGVPVRSWPAVRPERR
jgi:hypothetical protein